MSKLQTSVNSNSKHFSKHFTNQSTVVIFVFAFFEINICIRKYINLKYIKHWVLTNVYTYINFILTRYRALLSPFKKFPHAPSPLNPSPLARDIAFAIFFFFPSNRFVFVVVRNLLTCFTFYHSIIWEDAKLNFSNKNNIILSYYLKVFQMSYDIWFDPLATLFWASPMAQQ